MLSCSSVSVSATTWTVARQVSLSMEFSRQEYWSGLPFPSPGDLPDPGIEPAFLASPALAGGFLTTEPSGSPASHYTAPRYYFYTDAERLTGRVTLWNS